MKKGPHIKPDKLRRGRMADLANSETESGKGDLNIEIPNEKRVMVGSHAPGL